MPGPQVDPLGGVGQVAQHDIVGREVRVLVQEVVLGHPHVLEARLVGRLDHFELVHEGMVLGVRINVLPEFGDVSLNEKAEFHAIPLLFVAPRR